jgi:cytochrome c-type biogenesis protein CcmH
MQARRRRWLALVALIALFACDRRVEKLDPNERPQQPDLSKIFPPGAERRAVVPAEMPPAPRGAPPMPETQADASDVAEGASPIRGTLTLADALRDRMPEGAVLFLIARRGAAGPPLAVKRIATPSFPLDFELGPDDRMIRTLPFVGPLQLSARIDADGNAMSRAPGDLQSSASVEAMPGDTGVALAIDSVL